MLGWIFGILFVVVGFAGTTNALNVVDRAARLWPRAYRRGDAGLFSSSAFLIRFVSLMLLAVGVALIWLAAFGPD